MTITVGGPVEACKVPESHELVADNRETVFLGTCES